MTFMDMFRVSRIKTDLDQTQTQLALVQKERDALQATLSDTEHMSYFDLKRTIAELSEEKDKLMRTVTEQREQAMRTLTEEKEKAARILSELEKDTARKRKVFNQQLIDLNLQTDYKRGELDREIQEKKHTLVEMDEEILLQSFGFYKPRYNLMNSDAYKERLEQIRQQQESMVKSGKAASGSTSWTVNNSKREGERMVKDYVKLILRSFNNECDASIVNVKFNNIESIEKRIRKAFDVLNTLGSKMTISISLAYLDLKIQELYLCHEYQIKKQQEKEEQKLLREKMREEAKALKEIEDMKLKIGKEEKHFTKALITIEAQLLRAETEAEREMLVSEKASIEHQIVEIEQTKQDILNREQNTRAGYVYIISNVGSFGENIYKIGVTRRLDPQERVDELGDASVPFEFDIHALVFSNDAPALETALHRAFEHRRLNLVNRRREFFNATLDEIKQVVVTNFSKPVEFIELADAPEYRQSLLLKQNGIPVQVKQSRMSVIKTK